MPYYVYFAKSLRNGKVYVGSTSINPVDRIKQHNSGSNQYSSSIKPLKFIYYEEYVCREDSMKREKFYKSGFGRKIKGLIVNYLIDMGQ